MVWSKNSHFCQLLSLVNKGQENVFYDILERKNAFQAIKTKSSKGQENSDFSKGVTHGFGPTMAIFPTFFFLGNIGQENVFYDILEKKKTTFKTIKKTTSVRYDIRITIFQQEYTPFQGIKTRSFKSQKNRYFAKKVNPWYWSKNGRFSNFFILGNIGHESVFYDILQRKNEFLGYKKEKFKRSKD